MGQIIKDTIKSVIKHDFPVMYILWVYFAPHIEYQLVMYFVMEKNKFLLTMHLTFE